MSATDHAAMIVDGLPKRARNALHRSGVSSDRQLLEMRCLEVVTRQGIGGGLARAIVAGVLAAGCSLACGCGRAEPEGCELGRHYRLAPGREALARARARNTALVVTDSAEALEACRAALHPSWIFIPSLGRGALAVVSAFVVDAVLFDDAIDEPGLASALASAIRGRYIRAPGSALPVLCSALG